MKLKISAVLFLMALGAIPMFGQGGQGGQRPGGGQGQRPPMTEESVTQRVKDLSKTLELSEAQEKSLIDYEVETFKKNEEERQKLGQDREAIREYMIKARQLRDKKYEEVLTAEQWKKYLEQREQRRAAGQGRSNNQ